MTLALPRTSLLNLLAVCVWLLKARCSCCPRVPVEESGWVTEGPGPGAMESIEGTSGFFRAVNTEASMACSFVSMYRINYSQHLPPLLAGSIPECLSGHLVFVLPSLSGNSDQHSALWWSEGNTWAFHKT